MYKANDSIYKRKVREILYNKTVKVVKGTNKRFLSLCNTTFEIETKLLEKYTKSKCYCYEIDKDIYNKALKLAPKNITLINDDVHKFSEYEQVNTHYSFVWLDFCCSYTEEFINKIIETVSTMQFAANAILAITLNKKRGRASNNIEFNKIYKNYKDRGFAKHIAPFINGNVTDIERLQYTCKDICPTGATMNLFIFTIKN